MAKEIVKEYSNGEITIIWKPGLCSHSEICVNTLPEVYRPNEKPWIQIENASTEALRAQVKKCPSGALSYDMANETDEATPIQETKVEVLKNGPLLVYGTLKVIDKDGHAETKKRTTAFCRCGESLNKPYCDGTHVKVGFKD